MKATKRIFLLAFVVFVVSVGLKTTIYAATSKVTNLKQVEAHETSVSVSWDGVLGVSSYTLKKTSYYHYYYIYVKANGVKSGKKTYSSTEAVYAPITRVYYYKYSGASNDYTTYSK